MGLAAEPCLQGPRVPALTLPVLGEGAPKALRAGPLALPASRRMGLPSCRSLTPSRAARQPLQGAFRREAIFGAGVLGSCSHEKPSHVCPQSCVGGSSLAGLVSKCPVLRGEQTSIQLGFPGPYKQMPFSSINQNSVARDGLKIKFCLGVNCQLLCCRGCLPA